MLEHVSLRCSDAKASRRFYERTLAPLGYVCDLKYADAFGFKDEAGRHDFWVTRGEVGTPTHLAFLARSPEAIAGFHAAALEAGGKDNGGPGPREGYAAYAAFVIDPDGNNVEAVIWEGGRKASGRPRSGAKRSTSERSRAKRSGAKRSSAKRSSAKRSSARPRRAVRTRRTRR